MAWYAELKRRGWFCINSMYLNYVYSNYEYDIWYNSLSQEDKDRLAEIKKQREEKRIRELEHCVNFLLGTVNNIMNCYRNT